jgi:16S rRNA (cytidine1402-2'-O)-methyltransferase
MAGTLFLLPCPIADSAPEAVLAGDVIERARTIRRFLAEDAKSARAFLKAIRHPVPAAQLAIAEIGHEPDPLRFDEWLAPIAAGADAALVAEAGCPAVADPGARLIAEAHRRSIRVCPLAGPSAILLALMASGLDGQRFRFHGYLPKDAAALRTRLRELERASTQSETQLFIETPYRNQRTLDAVLAACAPATRLSIAVDLTGAGETIATRTVAAWRALPAQHRPQLAKRPAVFSLLAAPGTQRRG